MHGLVHFKPRCLIHRPLPPSRRFRARRRRMQKGLNDEWAPSAAKRTTAECIKRRVSSNAGAQITGGQFVPSPVVQLSAILNSCVTCLLSVYGVDTAPRKMDEVTSFHTFFLALSRPISYSRCYRYVPPLGTRTRGARTFGSLLHRLPRSGLRAVYIIFLGYVTSLVVCS